MLGRWVRSPGLSCVSCSMALTVYTVVPKEDMETCVTVNSCRVRYVSRGKDYVGLRQSKEDAVERAVMIYHPTPVKKETHIFLKTTFTAAGFAKYGTLAMPQHHFVPKLSKKVYYPRPGETPYDWQVWHWNGDLPFDDCDLMVSAWEELDD